MTETARIEDDYVLESKDSGLERDVLTGTCPRCRTDVSFKKASYPSNHSELGMLIAIKCNPCGFISTYSLDADEIYPDPQIDSLDDLPERIDQYYQEAIRCIEANAPNGAATVFRKVLSAVCAHYDITDVDDDAGFYEMINTLNDEGHIVEKQRKALLATKDAGNDGAHLNANDPDIETAGYLKNIIDSILLATIKADQNIKDVRDKHPNPHQE
jgi:hypothetical protein